jgi:hypothetical protein
VRAQCSAKRLAGGGIQHVAEQPGESKAAHVLLQGGDAEVDCSVWCRRSAKGQEGRGWGQKNRT